MDTAALLPSLTALVLEAGEITLKYFRREGVTVHIKGDDSPVTRADRDAEAHILKGLAALTPDIPVIAEEAVSAGKVPDIGDRPFWLVDPVDGTKEFISGSGEYTVNIGLIVDDAPVLGLVYTPPSRQLYIGLVGQGARRSQDYGKTFTPITVREHPADGITVVASKRHGDTEKLEAYLKDYTVKDFQARGSSLKFLLIASGEADLYPRFGGTYEWDTAAADAILRAAGGMTYGLDGAPLRYRKPQFYNEGFVVKVT